MNINRITSAPHASVMAYLFALQSKTIRVVSTGWCRLKMRLWGIKFGEKCSFRGNMLFFCGTNSSISIGDHCTFNNSSRFNFRGINHRCILQTHKGGRITIGSHCGFSGVSIVSNVCVTIGNHVLVGANTMIGDRNDHENPPIILVS